MSDAPRAGHGATGAVAFAQVHQALAMFAQAVAGRALALEPAAPGADEPAGPAVAFDGETIRLPATVDDFASALHNRGAYRTMVLHQVGQLVFGSFAFVLDEGAPPVDGRPRGPSDLDRFIARAPDPRLLRRVFVVLEDLRVDAALRRTFPGARGDQARVLAHALASRPQAASGSPRAALVEALVRYSLGAPAVALVAGDATGACRPMLELAARVERPGATVHHTVDAAVAICALLRRGPAAGAADGTGVAEVPAEELGAIEPLAAPTAEENSLPAGWAVDDADGEAAPGDDDLGPGGVDFRGELRTDLVYRRSAAGGGLGPDDPVPVATTGAVGDDDEAAGGRAPGGRTATNASPRSGAERSFLYDEWDYHAQRYVRAWCRLHEYRVRGDDVGFLTEVRHRHAALAAQVRRRFGMMRPEAWQRVHRMHDGEELDVDAVIDALVARRAGVSMDEQLYVRRDRARREVATAFLVDLSASTGSPIPSATVVPPRAPVDPDSIEYPYVGADDDPPGSGSGEPPRRAIDIAKESLALMCDALHVLGDQHAVFGFSGMGRLGVEFYVAKDFDDPTSPRTWAALAAMEPRRYTRMGPAIRHATAKIVRAPFRTKLLIVISDGYPQDSDYGPDPADKEYGVQDTARALHEAETAGVRTFCVTIDPAGNDYLRRMCPEHRYAVLDDVTSLPGELARLYRSLSTPASRPPRRAVPPADR